MAIKSPDKARLVLMAGADASGKSTLIKKMHLTNGLDIKSVEPTSWSEQAREFKIANLRAPIDEVLINRREKLYLGLHLRFAKDVKTELVQGHGVITTASPLITRVAHETMRQVIGVPNSPSIETIVEEWIEAGENIPDLIVNLHAPMEVIKRRIENRMSAGDSTEINWGFNALFYIQQYQKNLSEAVNAAARHNIECQTYDTSMSTPEKILPEIIRKLSDLAVSSL